MKWYKNGGRFDSIMFVHPTYGGELRKQVQKIARENGLEIKVVEKAGVTVKSILQREEWRGWQNHDNTCPLWRHSEENHGGGDFEVEIRVTDRSFGKPSRRLITEAVRIEEVNDCEAMNSKREWTYTNLNKVNVA